MLSLKNNRKDLGFFVIIFLINFIFKLIWIGEPSLWYDEIISAKDTLLSFGHIKHEAEWDKNPPFYHYVLWVWSKLFGISVISLRAMSAFFSSMSAVIIYFFIKNISDFRKGLIGCLIFSAHPYLVHYAQEARCYSLLVFLIIIDVILTKIVIEHPTIVRCVLLGIFNFLIFYTHYIAGLIMFSQSIVLLFLFKRDWLKLAFIYLTPIILVLLRFTKKQYQVLFLSGESSRIKANVPLSSIIGLMDALPKLFVSNVFFLLYLILTSIFIYRIIKEKLTYHEVSFKLFILLGPLVSIVALFLLGYYTNVFDARYLIFTLPCVIISFSVIVENRKFLFALTGMILVFQLANIRLGASKRMDYKFAAFLAKKIKLNTDSRIFVQSADVGTLFLYYYDFDSFKLFYNNDELKRLNMSKGDLIKKIDLNIFTLPSEITAEMLGNKKVILLFQTYQKKSEEIAIDKFFASQNYSKFTTNSIEGVRFTYYFRK